MRDYSVSWSQKTPPAAPSRKRNPKGMILFGISKNFYFSLFTLFISGACDNISVVVRGTIMQTLVPVHMKGKVYAVNSMFIGSSNEIGEFESGMAAKGMGVVPSVVFGGTMTLLVVLFTYFRAPKLKNLNFDPN